MQLVVLKNFKCGGKRHSAGDDYDGSSTDKDLLEELKGKNLVGSKKELDEKDATAARLVPADVKEPAKLIEHKRKRENKLRKTADKQKVARKRRAK